MPRLRYGFPSSRGVPGFHKVIHNDIHQPLTRFQQPQKRSWGYKRSVRWPRSCPQDVPLPYWQRGSTQHQVWPSDGYGLKGSDLTTPTSWPKLQQPRTLDPGRSRANTRNRALIGSKDLRPRGSIAHQDRVTYGGANGIRPCAGRPARRSQRATLIPSHLLPVAKASSLHGSG